MEVLGRREKEGRLGFERRERVCGFEREEWRGVVSPGKKKKKEPLNDDPKGFI